MDAAGTAPARRATPSRRRCRRPASGAAAMAGMSARLQKMADDFAAGVGPYAVPSSGMPSSATTATGTTSPVTVQKVEVNTGAVLTNQQDLTIYIQNALGEISKLGNGSLIPAGSIAFQ